MLSQTKHPDTPASCQRHLLIAHIQRKVKEQAIVKIHLNLFLYPNCGTWTFYLVLGLEESKKKKLNDPFPLAAEDHLYR